MKEDGGGVKDYNIYIFSTRERMQFFLQGCLAVTVTGYLFYKSMIGIIILTPLVYFYLKKKRNSLTKERKWKLNLEFRDGILALAAALEAGYSAENALRESCRDLALVYPEDAMIIQEFAYMANQIRTNITVEKALEDFAARSGIEDIQSFAEVFGTAKRTGGDLIHVIKLTGNMISDKIEVKREIITLITAKRLEANIMKGIPLLLLIYLSVCSPGFLDPLYHNILGAILMTGILIGYFGAYLVIDKIIAIEV